MSVRDLGKTKKCENCGKKFIVKSPTQKYCCRECAVEIQRKQIRIYKGIADKPLVKRGPYTGNSKKRKIKTNSFGLYTKRK